MKESSTTITTSSASSRTLGSFLPTRLPSNLGQDPASELTEGGFETTLELSGDGSNSSTVHESEGKPIKIVGLEDILSVAFLVDGKQIVSGGDEGKIRRWRTVDGKEVEVPIDARSTVINIAVSPDGKWIVSGTSSGELTVWDVLSHEKVTGWKGHKSWVYAVDISPDGKRIATGSYDGTICVWLLSTGEQLSGLSRHDHWVVGVKFSPNGRLIASATQDSIRVWDSQNGRCLVNVPVSVAASANQSLAWVNNSNSLFALSPNGKINYLDASTGTMLSSWPIHNSHRPRCIALARNGTFITASVGSSVSFWDTTTHEQIGPIISHTGNVSSMAISENYDLVIGGGTAITLWSISDELPSSYCEDVSALSSKVHCAGFVPSGKSLMSVVRSRDFLPVVSRWFLPLCRIPP